MNYPSVFFDLNKPRGHTSHKQQHSLSVILTFLLFNTELHFVLEAMSLVSWIIKPYLVQLVMLKQLLT